MRNWYYVEDGNRVGPVPESNLAGLVAAGVICDETLVWFDGLGDWIPYSEARVQAAGEGAAEAVQAVDGDGPARRTDACCECGRTFTEDDMILLEGSWVCAECKPIVLQKLREGMALPGTLSYAGFWIRFAAKFLDGIIVLVVNSVAGGIIGGVVGGLLAASSGSGSEPQMLSLIVIPILNVFVQLVVGACYSTFFVGRFGATPGKMACGLRIIMPDGGRVSYTRALGRHFAEMLSGLILMIGYIMAAFDSEKRALHDHICNTRVVRK